MNYQLYAIRRALCGAKNLILRNTKGSLLKPRWLWFEVTDRCNSRCLQCNIWSNKGSKDELSPAEIKKTLSDPIFNGVEGIWNAGGEPSLRNDLEEIILAEHEAIPKAAIQISTNGLLPERIIDTVKFAIQNKINISVGTSLDALGADHDAIRGVEGNFKKVEQLLQELSALNKEHNNGAPSFGFTLIDRSLPHLESVRQYAEKIGVGFLIQWYNQSPFFKNLNKELATGSEAMIKAVQGYPPSIINESGIKWLNNKSIRFECFALHTFCMLHSNGDMSPCLGHWELKAGNVRENSPTRIWLGEEAKKIRKAVMACSGCLNSCGVLWSADSSFYPYLFFKLKQLFRRHKRFLTS